MPCSCWTRRPLLGMPPLGPVRAYSSSALDLRSAPRLGFPLVKGACECPSGSPIALERLVPRGLASFFLGPFLRLRRLCRRGCRKSGRPAEGGPPRRPCHPEQADGGRGVIPARLLVLPSLPPSFRAATCRRAASLSFQQFGPALAHSFFSFALTPKVPEERLAGLRRRVGDAATSEPRCVSTLHPADPNALRRLAKLLGAVAGGRDVSLAGVWDRSRADGRLWR